MILIERYVGFEKPDMLGKLYIAYIDGVIDWNELTMYAEVVDRFLPGDYAALNDTCLDEVTQDSKTIDAVLRLLAMGLLAQKTGLVTEYDEESAGLTLSGAKGYVITGFGMKLRRILNSKSLLT